MRLIHKEGLSIYIYIYIYSRDEENGRIVVLKEFIPKEENSTNKLRVREEHVSGKND